LRKLSPSTSYTRSNGRQPLLGPTTSPSSNRYVAASRTHPASSPLIASSPEDLNPSGRGDDPRPAGEMPAYHRQNHHPPALLPLAFLLPRLRRLPPHEVRDVRPFPVEFTPFPVASALLPASRPAIPVGVGDARRDPAPAAVAGMDDARSEAQSGAKPSAAGVHPISVCRPHPGDNHHGISPTDQLTISCDELCRLRVSQHQRPPSRPARPSGRCDGHKPRHGSARRAEDVTQTLKFQEPVPRQNRWLPAPILALRTLQRLFRLAGTCLRHSWRHRSLDVKHSETRISTRVSVAKNHAFFTVSSPIAASASLLSFRLDARSIARTGGRGRSGVATATSHRWCAKRVGHPAISSRLNRRERKSNVWRGSAGGRYGARDIGDTHVDHPVRLVDHENRASQA